MADRCILALDLATTTGWAVGRISDFAPDHGSVTLVPKDSSMARLFAEARDWLQGMVAAHPGIDVVVFESPLPPFFKKGQTRTSTVRKLIGLAAIIEEELFGCGLDVREATVPNVRRHFIGHNPKREIAKDETIAACRRLGWKPIDDNAADALALWHYQASIFEPKILFRRG